ncbi:MAG: dihydroorotate dehydrogenase electron transfer subunit [Actinobacteria bacterium]|nr:dihydroorotate dehydrogenase electron transfer subunit [Actinomycetota bacterium]
MSEPRTRAPFGRRLARVESKVELGAYALLTVADRAGPAGPRPGQFYMLAAAERWGGDGERPYLPRAFSYARVRPAGGVGDGAPDFGSTVDSGCMLEFLLEAVGPGTRRLAELEPGDAVWLTGPLGVGFRIGARPGVRRLLVGGGIGTAPIVCLSDDVGEGGEVLLGFRSGRHARAAELFGTPADLATDDGSVGRHALVTELLRERLDDGGSGTPEVYACGPPPMLEAVRAICAERDVGAQLALESGMACGFGACFGCVAPTRRGYVRLCVDGPVLDASDLDTALFAGAGH